LPLLRLSVRLLILRSGSILLRLLASHMMADRAASRRAKRRVTVTDKVSGYATGCGPLQTPRRVRFSRDCQ
jgi:hypothetical protein